MDLREIVDWIQVVQDRDKWQVLVNTLMNHQFPLNAGDLLIK
jgi:hypothetical protein